jgi:hypothetical protein
MHIDSLHTYEQLHIYTLVYSFCLYERSCAPNKRASQIPGYSGFIGSDHTENLDNPNAPYRPFTVKRNETPAYAKSSWSPQLPHFAGHIPGVRV